MAEALFVDLELPVPAGARINRGYSSSDEVLEKIAEMGLERSKKSEEGPLQLQSNSEADFEKESRRTRLREVPPIIPVIQWYSQLRRFLSTVRTSLYEFLCAG